MLLQLRFNYFVRVQFIWKYLANGCCLSVSYLNLSNITKTCKCIFLNFGKA